MKMRPAVLREDFWGDLANTFLLRPVYRETKQEQEAKAAETKSEENKDKAAAEPSNSAYIAETSAAAAAAADVSESVRTIASLSRQFGRHALSLPAVTSVILEASHGRVFATSEAFLKDWNATLQAGVDQSRSHFAIKASGTEMASASTEASGTEADGLGSSQTQESVALSRALYQAEPEVDRYAWSLAGSLLTHARALVSEGKPDKAVGAAGEAVDIYRSLQLTGDFRAYALNTYADVLTAVGREAEAVDLGVEATQVYEELADKYPNGYEPGLVAAMISLSKRLSNVGEHGRALANSADAVLRTRKMEDEIPGGHTADLALALANHAERLGESGEVAEASEVLNEAAELYAKLAEQYPLSYTAQLETVLELLRQWSEFPHAD